MARKRPPARTSKRLEVAGLPVEAPTTEERARTGASKRLYRLFKRRKDRREKREADRSIRVVVSEGIVPAGSLLSEATLSQIRGGNMTLVVVSPPPQTPPSPTYAQKLKRRAKANRLKRTAGEG